MKLKQLFPVVLMMCVLSITAQDLNVQFRAQLQYPGQTCANICGYVDSLGNEYALVGASKGMSIVDVTNPSSPVQVMQVPGPDNLWREIKVRGKYAYVTTEGGDGLQIVNLSSLPDTTGVLYHNWTGDTVSGLLNTIHALHIDSHYVYLYGSNLFGGGALVADITDPWNPVYAGHYQNVAASYVHDGYVRNDTLYAGHIYNGFFSVVDFTDKANPVEITNQNTPGAFTHNTWLSTNSKILFTTDEVDNSYLTSYDISDLSNITELDRIKTPGSMSVVHNTHIIHVGGSDYAVTSWYKEGFKITDVSRPQNMVHVGSYDTYAGEGGGFEGTWGVYPYLPSGTIVVSNIDEGLFIFTPTYVRACYLEGNVTDSVTGFPINNATIEILTTASLEKSKLTGDYATGIPSPGGTYNVTYSKPGYYPKTLTGVVLSPTVVTTQNVVLSPIPTFVLNGQVTETGSGNAIANAKVSIKSTDFTFEAITDGSGNFSIPAVYPGTYDIAAGHWGHITNCSQTMTIDSTTGAVIIQLEKGYYDDFTFDFGWTINSTATLGVWERGIPNGTFYGPFPANPGIDDSTDCFSMAYVTGNTGASYNDQDVDDGYTTLTSPLFDLTGYANPYLDYTRWFFNNGGAATLPNDSLKIYFNNGIVSVLVDFVTIADLLDHSKWIHRSFKVSDYISPTSSMKIIVSTADDTLGNLVEAGFDKFFITEGPDGIEEKMVNNLSNVNVYPNPFGESISVSYELNAKIHSGAMLTITDVAGRIVDAVKLLNQKDIVYINPSVNPGIYFVRIANGNEITVPVKIIKMK